MVKVVKQNCYMDGRGARRRFINRGAGYCKYGQCMSHLHTILALTGHIHLLCNFSLDELPMYKTFTAITVHVLYITCKVEKDYTKD
jgi:hypothetical protein